MIGSWAWSSMTELPASCFPTGTRWNWTCRSRPGGYISPSDMVRGSRIGAARAGGDSSMLPNNLFCASHHNPYHFAPSNSPPPELYVDGILLESPSTFVLYSQLNHLSHLAGRAAKRMTFHLSHLSHPAGRVETHDISTYPTYPTLPAGRDSPSALHDISAPPIPPIPPCRQGERAPQRIIFYLFFIESKY